jgi:anaerobic magnesium-protoporphyrin IX monomethyl ester cyclase
MKNNLDLLLVEPCLDWKINLKRKKGMRITKKEDVKEGLKISTAYLIASIKNKGFKVKFIDMTLEEMNADDLIEYIRNNSPTIVGMPAFTFQIPVVIQLFSQIKKAFPNIILCIGGCHVSALPERTLEECPDADFVIQGEAETSMPMIIERINADKDISDISGVIIRGQKNSNDVFFEDVNNLPFPAWEEFRINKDLHNMKKPWLPITTGRGCPFRCVFCCRQSGDHCRRRTVESVMEEIERNIRDFDCNTISFMDETFILNKRWTDHFLDSMLSSGLNKKIKWLCGTRVNSVSLELLKRMKEAGCFSVFYGFENADENVLDIIKKGTTPKQMQNAVEWTKQSKIAPLGSFIVGLPGESKSTVLKTIEFGTNLDLYSITFQIAVPYPGTELREMALAGEYGMRVMSDDWAEYIANDHDIYGRGKIGHLESVDLPWQVRRELQKYGYSKNPKKDLSEYIRSLS